MRKNDGQFVRIRHVEGVLQVVDGLPRQFFLGSSNQYTEVWDFHVLGNLAPIQTILAPPEGPQVHTSGSVVSQKDIEVRCKKRSGKCGLTMLHISGEGSLLAPINWG